MGEQGFYFNFCQHLTFGLLEQQTILPTHTRAHTHERMQAQYQNRSAFTLRRANLLVQTAQRHLKLYSINIYWLYCMICIERDCSVSGSWILLLVTNRQKSCLAYFFLCYLFISRSWSNIFPFYSRSNRVSRATSDFNFLIFLAAVTVLQDNCKITILIPSITPTPHPPQEFFIVNKVDLTLSHFCYLLARF